MVVDEPQFFHRRYYWNLFIFLYIEVGIFSNEKKIPQKELATIHHVVIFVINSPSGFPSIVEQGVFAIETSLLN